MERKSFEVVFSRRCVFCFAVMALLFFSCVLRVAVTAMSDYSSVSQTQSSYRLTAERIRGTIYDCNMIPLTNAETVIMAAVSPTPRAITAISSVLEGEEQENVLERLRGGKPVLCRIPRVIDCDGVACVKVYIPHSADTLAVHAVGYTDYEGHGAAGLEKAYDDLLYTGQAVSFVYTVNGRGDVLEGIAPEVENDTSGIASGVVSTLDANLQIIAEEEAEKLESGAVLIADSATSKIRAMVSRPTFDTTNIGDYLGKDDSPLWNRATAAYNVGSVFKACVAAAGIEAGKGDYAYTCTGSCHIIDRDFRCHKQEGHGAMTLKSGLAYSCNTYFYNFAFLVGGDAIWNLASALNFGKSFAICQGISVAAGSMPERENLSNIARLANFSIGQGELTVSPVAMLNLYASITGDGGYYLPSLVEGTVKDGKFTEYDIGAKTRVMQAKTAALLREYLAAVITEGTGVSAAPKSVSAAGKTATAQTGKVENGREICEGWFCGFFPAENPRYTVVVFSENTAKQAISCGEIFARIADRATALEE